MNKKYKIRDQDKLYFVNGCLKKIGGILQSLLVTSARDGTLAPDRDWRDSAVIVGHKCPRRNTCARWGN